MEKWFDCYSICIDPVSLFLECPR